MLRPVLLLKFRRFSSAVEQWFCKPKVGSSILSTGTINEETTMSKMSDFLKKAADKKKGIHHLEGDDAPVVERKTAKQRAPVIGKKPPTRSAGRGR